MEAAKKVCGLDAATVIIALVTMEILWRIEPFSDVKSATQTYAAIVYQFAEIPKIQTASIQRNYFLMQNYKAWAISLTTLSSVQLVLFILTFKDLLEYKEGIHEKIL